VPLKFIFIPTTSPIPHQNLPSSHDAISHNFRVQVFVARGRSEWFVRVVVSAAVLVGLTPAVIVAAPAPFCPSIPMTVHQKNQQSQSQDELQCQNSPMPSLCFPSGSPAFAHFSKCLVVLTVPPVCLFVRTDQYCGNVAVPRIEGALMRHLRQTS
jgi:hypothetical protein